MGTRSAQKYLTAGSSILGWEKMLSKFYHNKRQEKIGYKVRNQYRMHKTSGTLLMSVK